MFFLKMIDSKTKETLYYQGKKSSGSSLEMVSGSYASLKSAKEAACRFLRHCDDLLLELILSMKTKSAYGVVCNP